MIRGRTILLTLPLTLILMGQSCSVSKPSGPTPGGVFRSTDAAASWQQMVYVGQDQEDKAITINGVGITKIVFAPQDPDTIYAVAGANGLFRTENKGEQWKRLLAIPVSSILLHPHQPKVIYVASENKLWRTTDTGANWQPIYLEATPEVIITDLEQDQQNPNSIYLGTNKGVIALKSSDGGEHWQLSYLFKQPIKRLKVNPVNSNIIYAAQPNGTIWRSGDSFSTWTDITLNLKEQLDVRPRIFQDITFLPGEADGFIYINQQGLYRSLDGGLTWVELPLLTAPNSVRISALAVNPARRQDIWYATGGVLFNSTDNGASWRTLPLPSALTVSSIIVHPREPDTIYLSFSR